MSKQEFVREFSNFLLNNVPYFGDVNGLVYIENDEGEWIYVNYRSHSQKRIYVTADSEYAMMKDFFRYIESEPYIDVDPEIFNMT